jgi:predicted ester cyclase
MPTHCYPPGPRPARGCARSAGFVTRKLFRGTHQAPFQGIEPTGREVEIHVIDIVRVRNDQIVEHWNRVDRLGLLAQLGAAPQ